MSSSAQPTENGANSTASNPSAQSTDPLTAEQNANLSVLAGRQSSTNTPNGSTTADEEQETASIADSDDTTPDADQENIDPATTSSNASSQGETEARNITNAFNAAINAIRTLQMGNQRMRERLDEGREVDAAREREIAYNRAAYEHSRRERICMSDAERLCREEDQEDWEEIHEIMEDLRARGELDEEEVKDYKVMTFAERLISENYWER